MSKQVDDEMENYQAKYGLIEPNDEYFDDHPELGFDYLQYKISKIKFWKSKKGNNVVIAGIQTTYKNIKSDSNLTSEEHRGENDNNLESVEFNLAAKEYITYCSLCYNESMLFKLTFKTNLKNEFSVGDKVGNEIEVSGLKGKKKFVLSFFGTFGKQHLTSIGLFINKSEEFFDYFLKGYFQLKIFLSDKSNLSIVEKKIENNEFNYEDMALIKAVTEIPKNLFHEVIRFISPV